MRTSKDMDTAIDQNAVDSTKGKKKQAMKKTVGSMARNTARASGFALGAGLSTAAAAATIGTAAALPVIGPATIAVGSLAVTSLLKKYGSFAVNKKTAPVDPVSDTWKARPKANMVKWLMKQSGVGLDTIAEYLGCSVSYLNTKLARDSFSFEDLILAAYACGYTFTLADNNGEGEAVYRVDILRHFENKAPEVLERIDAIEEDTQTQKQRREEYEKKKAELEAELERMKEEYGVED